MQEHSDWAKKAALIRKWSLISTTEAGSGHPTSCLSAADLMTVFFDKYFTYDTNNPNNLLNDRLLFSKGHGAPLLYSLYAAAGAFPFEELRTLRRIDSRLEGHPTPEFPYTEAATGSLGQGLSIGAGMAFAMRAQVQSSKFKVQSLPKVYVLLGDGETASGQVWEAANFSSYYHLDNLIAVVDVNRFGQSQETMFEHRMEEYINRFSAFDWEVLAVDGHNFKEIDRAFHLAKNNKSGKPFVIIAKTIKGKGVGFWEDKNGFHSKPLNKEQLEDALEEIGNVSDEVVFSLKKPKSVIVMNANDKAISLQTTHVIGEKLMTKEVYGKALIEVAKKNELVLSLDGDVKNSTSALDFKNAFPDRYIECFIAEQNMIGVSVGLSRLGYMPFASTFSVFFTRAFDQIRMARLSEANIRLVGSYAGVSLGKDGTSQMGLEDMAMIGAIPDSTILYPADAVATEKLVGIMPSIQGISYVRLSRPKVPVIYEHNKKFKVGGSIILRASKRDVITVVAGGITVHEALKAYDILKQDGITVRIVDCYCVKPIDKNTLLQCVTETKKQALVTVEDHFLHGGLGDFVLEAVAEHGIPVHKMAVTHISHSGEEADVIDAAGISSAQIVKKVKSLL